ncbi:MAG: peptidoglycan DD-metalloendopeptidase family protein [Propionibacteriaceae bacterium]|jgi:murein DD-endopeptidase MepM/ murein hydrolase activator NlpD|nr:peptidoglycan DD-metalloendopeptidase family protein [Propionibacteriaceae bacterium]
MRKVSSPTPSVSDEKQPESAASLFGIGVFHAARTAAAALVALTLIAGQTGSATADPLKDLQESRKELQGSIVDVKKDIARTQKAVEATKSEVKTAAAKLQESSVKLQQAQAKLKAMQGKLAVAKEKKAKADAAHQAAKEAVLKAKAAVEKAKGEVADQKSLIGIAVRQAYQQHSDLLHYSVVLNADSIANLSSRLQWSETIFDSTAAQLNRLKELQTQFEAAKTAQVRAEKLVASKAKEAKAQVDEVQSLTKAAAAQAASVSALVTSNRKAKAAAEAELRENETELEQDRAQYKKLQQEEEKIAAKILAEMAKDDGDSWSTASKTGFVYPVHAKPGSPFGMRYHPILHYNRMHWGQDFGAKCGAPLYAMADGKVTSASWTSTGFGYYTIINYGKVDGKNISSGYAHQSKLGVKAGQFVAQGQVVGYVGTTGLSTGCHLHLQIYENGVRVNPMKYLK